MVAPTQQERAQPDAAHPAENCINFQSSASDDRGVSPTALENHRRGALTKALKRFAAKFAATTACKIFDGGAGQ
jgi:hypothetical protein